MTIEERIKKNNERIEEMKDYVRKCECGYYHDNRTCEAEKHWIEDYEQQNKWLEELQAHREAWGKVKKRLRDKHSDPYSMHCAESYFMGVYDAIKIINEYRPKEGMQNDGND